MSLEENTSRFGSAVNNTVGTVQVEKSTISDNSAERGGGVRNEAGTITLDEVRLTGNSAVTAGGIWNGGTVDLVESKVVGNIPDNCAPAGTVPGCTG